MTAPGERTDPAPTDEQIAEWVALADAATDGPWYADSSEVYAPAGEWVCEGLVDDRAIMLANTSFIAAARTAVPALAAALSSARAENERIGAAWADVIQREQRSRNAALYDSEQAEAEIDRLRAENAALHESLNVTAERAAGDRRALDEARRRVDAALAEIDQGLDTIRQMDAPATLGAWTDARAIIATIGAALAAAQPTESAPR